MRKLALLCVYFKVSIFPAPGAYGAYGASGAYGAYGASGAYGGKL